MANHEVMFKVNLKDWVMGTIRGVDAGEDWKTSWQKTYRAIGGESNSVCKKGCPCNGTKTLYDLGRIKNAGIPYKEPSLQDIWDNHSKNGAYSILALELLDEYPDIALADLWGLIQSRIRKDLGEEAAKSNQGGPTIAYKLWHMDMTVVANAETGTKSKP